MKILLIEDDEKIAQFIKNGFKKVDYRIDIAKDGEEGLYMAQNNDYDVLIVDWMLPQLSGIELLKKLKKVFGENKILPTIRNNIALAEAPNFSKSINEYKPSSNATFV